MGAAMLFVMFFHVSMPKSELMYGVVRCGNIGVDMFLFLSGIGLWFSWTKTPSLRYFYWRRYIRIYPAWIIVAACFYVQNYLELSISAQSNLILKEAGMPTVHDPASKSMLVEMAELKDRIGPTAEYALRPIVKRSQVNRWAMENLV